MELILDSLHRFLRHGHLEQPTGETVLWGWMRKQVKLDDFWKMCPKTREKFRMEVSRNSDVCACCICQHL